MKKHKLRVLVDIDNGSVRTKTARSSFEKVLGSTFGKVLEIETDMLAKEMASAFSNIVRILSSVSSASGEFPIETISFSVGVDSAGKVSLLSTLSSSLSTQVGFTFTLKVSKDKNDVTISST